MQSSHERVLGFVHVIRIFCLIGQAFTIAKGKVGRSFVRDSFQMVHDNE